MADEKLPMVELHCLNGECGLTFEVELSISSRTKVELIPLTALSTTVTT